MMLTKLIISNFKSHLHSEIDTRNLTVLTGINGCGKTSLIQALLLLRQTNMKGRLRDGLDLNTPLCKIGIGNDALCQYAPEGADREISVPGISAAIYGAVWDGA